MGTAFMSMYDIKSHFEEVSINYTVANPKVSIIVPTYNNSDYLAKCLFSLLEQSLKEIEIIVVNDGSTDITDAILSIFKQDSRIKVFNQEHKLQGAARNLGMQEAKGEYIGFVDSDDWVDLDYYEKLYKAAKKHNVDIALATNVRIGNGKTKKRLEIAAEVVANTLQSKVDIGNQAKNPCPTNKIYRRSMLEENNIVWLEGCYCEDKLFTIQAIYYANGIVAVPGVNYYYYRNPKSTVNSRSCKLTNDKQRAKRDVLNFLKEKNADIRDGEFWATDRDLRFWGVSLVRTEESLKSYRCKLLGIEVYHKSNRAIKDRA